MSHEIKAYIDKRLANLANDAAFPEHPEHPEYGNGYETGVVGVLDDLKEIIGYDVMVWRENEAKKEHDEWVAKGIQTLGQIINAIKDLDPNLPVVFDFNNLAPNGFSCYRGYYDHLALDWCNSNDQKAHVKDFIEVCNDANGREFGGWKGGEYCMGLGTWVWAADGPGDCSHRAVIGIRLGVDEVVIETKIIE